MSLVDADRQWFKRSQGLEVTDGLTSLEDALGARPLATSSSDDE